jgi:ADP-heptose:LPS heptosyltransferase
MKVVVSTTDITFSGVALRKGQRYVASDNVASCMVGAVPGVVRMVADATIYTRPWRGEDLTGKTLLVYRALGLGDEFLAARLCEVAKRRHNAAVVKFACFEAHHPIWAHAETPFVLLPSIVPWEDWASATCHVVGEHWWESLGTSDQPDCFGVMAAVCNIEIAVEDRLPLVPYPPVEVLTKTADHLNQRVGNRSLVLWQASATSKIRSYSVEQTHRAIGAVLEQTDAVVVVIGHPKQIEAYEIEETDRIATYSGGIPGLIALTAVAAGRRSCVVCPDSVLGHISAAYPKLPVVSLWSSFDPSRRVASYTTHKPIFNRIQCSPCWAHEQSGDPRNYKGCPLTACGDYCAGLRCIEPAKVAAAVVDMLGKGAQ